MTSRTAAISRTVLLAALTGAVIARAASPAPITLYSFGGGTDGAQPYGGMVIGSGGVLFGTTVNGGALGHGTVFSLTPPSSLAGSWTETVLYSFSGGNDGSSPSTALAIDSGGTLYGTTSTSGAGRLGVVFALTPPASPGAVWTEKVLHAFTGAPHDGASPSAGVSIGKDGVLYGTTSRGGTGVCHARFSPPGCGTVFSLKPPASSGGSWAETVLHSFAGYPSDGALPAASVVIGSSGVLYGTTSMGGAVGTCIGAIGCGTVFALTPSAGGVWEESVLYSFADGPDGGAPYGGLVVGRDGVLYGTASKGGTSLQGVVFALNPPALPGGSWTEKVLYTFNGSPTDGAYPSAGVVIGSGGVLYGATPAGGNGPCPGGCGMLFSLTPPAIQGSFWRESVLYNFMGGNDAGPASALVMDPSGLLYGTSQFGGTGNAGRAFSFQP